MRFKISLSTTKHEESATAVGWSGGDELISVGDDGRMLRWQPGTGQDATQLAGLPEGVYATDLHFYPRSVAGAVRKGATGSDLLAVCSTEGKFYLISKTGRVEKTVEAHRGAVLSIRWSYDGASLLTVGEDGLVKVWSRGGMLRSTLSQNSGPVYGGCWSADSTHVLYCSGTKLTIKPLQANASAPQWKAHDGLILCADWNAASDLIVSGGEDCKYRVWDPYGRQLFSSTPHQFPITTVAWSMDGDLFAMASFNTLRLCDKAGWSYCLDKPRTGGVFKVSWSPDGVQLAGACANGHVAVARIVDRRVEWRQLEAVQTKSNVVEMRDAGNTAVRDKLEVKDGVVRLAVGWDRVVLATANHCYMYNSKNWNTPVVVDLREGGVSLILMSAKNVLLVDGSGLLVYEYNGRLQCSVKYPAMRTDLLNERTTALSVDTLAVRDKVDERTVFLFDLENGGRPLAEGNHQHTHQVVQVALDRCGSALERNLVIVDKNGHVFVRRVRPRGGKLNVAKLGSMVRGVRFDESTNMLAGLQDDKLLVWCYPGAAFVDKALLSRTVLSIDATDQLGKHPSLVSFLGNRVTIRRGDGASIALGLSPFPSSLLAFVHQGEWDDALRLCRHVREDYLWATLAAAAVYAGNLGTAEVAYAAVNEAEKVQFLSRIRLLADTKAREAEMACLCGDPAQAESALLLSGHTFRAVMLDALLNRWDRALQLTTKHSSYTHIALAYRQRYLQELGRKETNAHFQHMANEDHVDWDSIQQRVRTEYDQSNGTV